MNDTYVVVETPLCLGFKAYLKMALGWVSVLLTIGRNLLKLITTIIYYKCGNEIQLPNTQMLTVNGIFTRTSFKDVLALLSQAFPTLVVPLLLQILNHHSKISPGNNKDASLTFLMTVPASATKLSSVVLNKLLTWVA